MNSESISEPIEISVTANELLSDCIEHQADEDKKNQGYCYCCVENKNVEEIFYPYPCNCGLQGKNGICQECVSVANPKTCGLCKKIVVCWRRPMELMKEENVIIGEFIEMVFRELDNIQDFTEELLKSWISKLQSLEHAEKVILITLKFIAESGFFDINSIPPEDMVKCEILLQQLTVYALKIIAGSNDDNGRLAKICLNYLYAKSAVKICFRCIGVINVLIAKRDCGIVGDHWFS